MAKNPPAVQEMQGNRFDPWVGKIPLEEEMATRSSNLAWRIPWIEEPGGLWSMGSQRVRHDLACPKAGASAALCTYCPM